jgi:hypothetical protein
MEGQLTGGDGRLVIGSPKGDVSATLLRYCLRHDLVWNTNRWLKMASEALQSMSTTCVIIVRQLASLTIFSYLYIKVPSYAAT